MKFIISLIIVLTMSFSFCSCELKSSSKDKDKDKMGKVMDDFSLSTTLPDGRVRIEGKLVEIIAEEKIIVENDKGSHEYLVNEKVKTDIKDLNINSNDMVVVITKNDECVSIEKVIT